MFLLPVFLQAQVSYHCRTYTAEDGLAQNSVFAIHFDTRGVMWIGTGDGLCRFDGKLFKTYRNDPRNPYYIKDNFVRRIFNTPQGNLLLECDKAICYYDISRNSFRTLFTIEEMRRKSASCVLAGGNDSNAFAICTDGKIVTIHIASGKYAISPLSGEMPEGIDYYGSAFDGNDIYVCQPSGLYKIDSRSGISKCIYQLKGRGGIKLGRTGRKLYFMDGSQLMVYHIDQRSCVAFDCASQFVNDKVKIEPKSENEIWLIHEKQGIEVLRPQHHQFVHYNYTNLQNTIYLSACHDGFGNTWIGTDGGGLHGIGPLISFISHYPLQNAYESSPTMVKGFAEEPDGHILVATIGKGLIRFDPTDGSWGKVAGFPNDLLNVVVVNQDIYAGNEQGLYHLPKGGKLVQYYLKGNKVFHIAPINDLLYLSTHGRLYTFDPVAHESKVIPHPGLNSVYFSFQDSENRLWLASNYEGISILSHESQRVLNVRNGLFNEAVRSVIQFDDRTFYAATEGGLARISEEQDGRFGIKYYTEKEGLPNSFIYGIVEDENSQLWVSTNRGLALIKPASDKIISFTKKDGLQGLEFNTGAWFKDRSGNIYFGGLNGFNIIHSRQKTVSAQIPKVMLVGFQAGAVEYGEKYPSQLASDRNNISISAIWPEFSDPLRNYFKFRIQSNESENTYQREDGKLILNSLKPGAYVITIRAFNDFTGVQSTDYIIKFQILPPWYLSWWFLTIAVFLVITIVIILVYFASTRKLRKQIAETERLREIEKLRIRISIDIHDDIGSGLSKLSLYSEMAKNQIHDPEALQQKLDNIGSESRNILNNMREIVWAMNPDYDRLDSLLAYLREMVSAYLDNTGITPHFNFPNPIPTRNVTPDFKRNINMIVRESMSNILKYADATEAYITYSEDLQNYTFEIRDNGVGISEEKIRKFGNGIRGIQKRAADINAVAEISSQPGLGTTVKISGKL